MQTWSPNTCCYGVVTYMTKINRSIDQLCYDIKSQRTPNQFALFILLFVQNTHGLLSLNPDVKLEGNVTQ